MTAPIAPIVDKVEDLTEQVDRKIREFIQVVTDVMNDVPDFLNFLLEPLRRTMAQVHELAQKFREAQDELLSKIGKPWRLSSAADTWGDAVANPITGAAGVIAPTKLAGDKRWEGYAADMYQAIAAEQLAGLNSIRDLASQLRASLESMSSTLTNFLIAILFMLIDLLFSLIGATLAAATVAGAPIGAATVVAAIAKAIAFGGVAFGATAMFLNEHEGEQASIRQKLADVGTEWPTPPTAELSDASVTDGDSSEWTPRR